MTDECSHSIRYLCQRYYFNKDTTLTYGGSHSQQQQLLSERFAKRSTRSERPFLPQPSTIPSLGVIDEVASLVEE